MKTPVLIALLCTLACAVGRAQSVLPSEVAAAVTEFENRVEQEAKHFRSTLLAPLEARYEEALKRGLKVAQESGNLSEARACERELDQLEARRETPPRVTAQSHESMPPGVEKLRKTYWGEVARHEEDARRRISRIVETSQKQLDDLSTALSRRGQLDEARSATLQRNRIGTARCKIVGAVPALFANGEKAFANRGYVWTEIDDSLTGLTFSQGSGNAAKPYLVEILRPGTLYISLNDENATAGIQQLKSLGFKQERYGFKYNAQGGTDMLLFSKFVVQSFTLTPPTGSFTGFVVIGAFE